MHTLTSLSRCAASIVVSAICIDLAHAQSQLVYSRPPTTPGAAVVLVHESPFETSSSHEDPRGAENFSQLAQLITLSGTSRYLTNLETYVTRFRNPSNISITTDATIRLYSADGPGINALPSSLLWEGTKRDLSLPLFGHVPLTFTPNITVPDRIFIAISHDNIRLSSFGQVTFGASCTLAPPQVGSARTHMRVQNTSTLAWSLDPFGDTQRFYMDARLTAVPSLGTLLPLLALPALQLNQRRRSK